MLEAALRRLQRGLEFRLATLERKVTPEAVHEVRTAARRLHAVLHGFRAQLSPGRAAAVTGYAEIARGKTPI